jgi:hypothetical protein
MRLMQCRLKMKPALPDYHARLRCGKMARIATVFKTPRVYRPAYAASICRPRVYGATMRAG